MTDQTGAPEMPDPGEMSKQFAAIAEQSQRIISEFLSRNADSKGQQQQPADPYGLGRAFLELTSRMLADPAKLVEAQTQLWSEYLRLWSNTTLRMLGQKADPIAKPTRDDRRFKDPAWDENVLFDYIKQSYLLTARWIRSTVHDVQGLDDHTAKKVDFYTRQFVDAMAPSNFVATNPQVLRETVESKGENLLRGLKNLLNDLEAGKGQLRISQTDMNAFEVGRNIAVTPGKVVARTDLAELLQYEPTTETVFRKPLLIVPPWINKFYILDLRPENSFIRWATSQGHTVFVLSWVNPDEHLARKSFGDYMLEGPLAAMDTIEAITGERQINAIGYCLGGTLLASTLAHMAARNDRDRILSATYFASLVDFTETGELSVFIDEEQLQAIEAKMSQKGYLEGDSMATTFNMLRANDLIWSFVVSNYLLGKDPFPFDLLYWNADSTRMPSAMHSFYLRNMYQRNLLAQPGGIELAGTPLDLGAIKTPTYIVAAREDHIAPWQGVYRGATLYGGPVRFVLAASGHIAGIINPPAAKKYSHWLNPKTPAGSDAWFAGAKETPGSWWDDWQKWVAKFAGDKVPARIPGAGGMPSLADAPGTYVKAKSDA